MLPRPLFKRAISLFLFRVGLCSHTIFLLQVTWPHRMCRIQAQTIDRVNPSPRDPPSTHVLKIQISGFDEKLTW